MAILYSVLTDSRQRQLKQQDRRVRLTTELLSVIRQIKLYAYEGYFGKRITVYREKELARLRKRNRSDASLTMLMVSHFRGHPQASLAYVRPKSLIPTLTAVLSFVKYSLTGHELTVATIFASLQLFNIVQAPMTQLPMVITSLSDNHIAIQRMSKILTAEEKPHGLVIKPTDEYAVSVTGDFSYETASPPDQLANDKTNGNKKATKAEKKRAKTESEKTISGSTSEEEDTASQPFMLKGINLHIPRGSLCVVYGRIGAGKTALLEGLLGEMRRTKGSVSFGGCLILVTQTPWIQSASMKDNILFGRQLDTGRLRETIHACALTKDIEQLDDGLDTEIGGQCHFLYLLFFPDL